MKELSNLTHEHFQFEEKRLTFAWLENWTNYMKMDSLKL